MTPSCVYFIMIIPFIAAPRKGVRRFSKAIGKIIFNFSFFHYYPDFITS